MEAIHVELSMKRDSGELYGAIENPFAVIAGRLARIFERNETEGQRERTRERESERSDVGRQYSLAVISSTKASLSLFSRPPSFPSCTLILRVSYLSYCLQNRSFDLVI